MTKAVKARLLLDEKAEECRAREDWSGLSEALAKYVKVVPEDEVTPMVLLADQAVWTGHYDEARLKLRQALQIQPDCHDARGLFGKLEWCQGNFQASLDVYNNLHHPEKGRKDYSDPTLTPRQLFLIVESLLYHAKSFESTGDTKSAVALYEQVMRQASRSGLMKSLSGPVQRVVEVAMLAIPGHLRHTDVRRTITSYRQCLNARFPLSTACRIRILSEFSNVLLTKCSSIDYPAIGGPHGSYALSDEVHEAALVLLLLGELVDKMGDREEIGLYDKLVIVFSQTMQYTALTKVLEAALNKNPHPILWYRLALALAAAGKYARVLTCVQRALPNNEGNSGGGGSSSSSSPSSGGGGGGGGGGAGQSSSLQQRQVLTLLTLAARTSLFHFDDPQAACGYIERAQRLPALRAGSVSALKSLLSCALSRKAEHLYQKGIHGRVGASDVVSMRNDLLTRALQLGHEAFGACPGSHEHSLQLSRLYAQIREVPRALHFARLSLELHTADVRSWALLALLLSTKKLHYFAIRTCDAGLKEVPAHPLLLLIKARLQFAKSEVKTSDIWPTVQLLLASLREGWRSPTEAPPAGVKRSSSWVDVSGEAGPGTTTSTTTGGGHTSSSSSATGGGAGDSTGDGGGGGGGGEGVDTGARRWYIESIDTVAASPSPRASFACDLWCQMAMLLLDHGVRDRVLACLEEARRWHPRSVQIALCLARYDHANGSERSAQVALNTALSLAPGHPEVLAALARHHDGQGHATQALSTLLPAAEAGASDPEVWMQLARVLQLQGDDPAAAEALVTAHGQSEVVPVLPFTLVPLHISTGESVQ